VTASPTPRTTPAPTLTASPTPVGALVGSGRTGGGDDDWGSVAAYLERLGVDPSAPETMLPIVLTAGGAGAFLAAFLLFGRRRRRSDVDPAEVTDREQPAASAGMVVVPPPPTPEPGSPEAELALPRWRRPSLMAARKADPSREGPRTAHRLSFDGGDGDPEGGERRTIRYTTVRLLDAPDELRAAEIGTLDHGDEVQVLEKAGTYWRVLSPDGREGWLHKTTLGPARGEASATPTHVDSRPHQSDVTPAPDSLAAYLASRARS
jgi:Bacterial SH3 domain